MQVSDEEVWCECSDDEMYNPGKGKKGTWQPKADDILKIFEDLKTKKVLELSWKCPGRRHPDSDVKAEEEVKEEIVTTPIRQTEQRPSIPNEFDFDDDQPDSRTMLTPRRTPGSAPRSEKKVARMDKVLKDMMQQRKLQAAEREARKQAGAKSSRTPGSPGRARIGSPAGSPRTPPISANRQSPVRSAAPPIDNTASTPLRAPIDSLNLSQRTVQKDSDKSSTHMVKNDPTHMVKNDPTHMVKNDPPETSTSAKPVTSLSNVSQSFIDTQASVFSQSQPREIIPQVQPRQATPPVSAGIAQSFQPPVSNIPTSNTADITEHMDTT